MPTTISHSAGVTGTTESRPTLISAILAKYCDWP